MLKLFTSVTVVAVTLLSAVPRAYGQYMSMFNSANLSAVNFAQTVGLNAALGNSVEIAAASSQSGGQSSDSSDWLAPTESADTPYQPIYYSVDPAVRAGVVETYMGRARAVDAAEGEALAQVFRDRDLFSETAQNFTVYGLDINDLGDVITAYWAVNWGAVHQSGRPNVAQVQGLRQQFRAALAGSQIHSKTTPAERQQIADDMLMRLILIDGGVEQGLREGNAAQLQSISDYVQRSSLSSMGIDLAALDLTTEGLALR
ncbi:MAG: DUF6683 family protein [Cyanobacteria bacterium P01_F01_bin.3]